MAIDPASKIVRQEQILLEKESRAKKNFIRRIVAEISTPSVYTIVRFFDIKQKIKSYFHKSQIFEYKSYKPGQKVALLAIWEYEELRHDVEFLIQELKNRDYYICIINTGKIDPLKLNDLCSVYISRFNYGRDFGSYKEGFLYLHRQGILDSASKVLMANDSIFFLRDNIAACLTEFENSSLKVLGATENYEIWHHLGSFFIMFDNSVTKSKKFIKFWKNYKVTDLRTKNIRYGEIVLTEIVKKIVPDNQVGAQWSLSLFSKYISSHNELSNAIALANRGHLTEWKKLSWQFVTKVSLQERIVSVTDFQSNPGLMLSQEKTDYKELSAINNFDGAVRIIQSLSDEKLSEKEVQELFLKAKGLFMTTAASGSQVHQNGNLLVSLGCPIVKLDLIYRGAFSYEDAEILFDNIENSKDRDQLRENLYRRAFGIDALRGWKRSAFAKGLI